MELIAHDTSQLPTRAELRELVHQQRVELHQRIDRQTRTFVTWVLASQSTLVALVVALVQRG